MWQNTQLMHRGTEPHSQAPGLQSLSVVHTLSPTAETGMEWPVLPCESHWSPEVSGGSSWHQQQGQDCTIRTVSRGLLVASVCNVCRSRLPHKPVRPLHSSCFLFFQHCAFPPQPCPGPAPRFLGEFGVPEHSFDVQVHFPEVSGPKPLPPSVSSGKDLVGFSLSLNSS